MITIFDDIREFRNASVHSGFRPFDFDEDHIDLYKKVLLLSYCQSEKAVKHALLINILYLKEFKEYSPYIFEEQISSQNINHIIDSLERK